MKKLFLAVILSALIFNAFGQQKLPYILDMVHNNPGEALTKTAFSDPQYLKRNGYTGQVVNEFTFAHAALTFDKLNPDIFPKGSKKRMWVMQAAQKVRENIKRAHQAGIKVYYFTDIIVLPKKLVQLYHNEICDKQGRISFERPKTIEIHRLMLDELFETFPDLDGLVIRTGETYLNAVPYHTGNGPITNGVQSHIKLINLLRDEVCVKYHKMVFYRTWSFGGMHDDPKYYLDVVDKIQPHPNLVFSIKHTRGDYHRTFDFNPTLGLGKHPQIVEVECQREYEGKGAYPNYVMNGVINGFEEYNTNTPQSGFKGLKDIKNSSVFKGVWSWSRGGGWVGPYISNEFWCRLNAYVISNWGRDVQKTEEQVFDRFMDENGIRDSSRYNFRQLCLLSAQAVIRGHESAVLPFKNDWTWWMRDEFLGGISAPDTTVKTNTSEGPLYEAFNFYYNQGLLQKAVNEKYDAVELWKKIEHLSHRVILTNKDDQKYLVVSSNYGLLLHQIIAEGWNIMALGFTGDKSGKYDKDKLRVSVKNYDDLWLKYERLKKENPDCATLYKPYAFIYIGPNYHSDKGMGPSVDKYRAILRE